MTPEERAKEAVERMNALTAHDRAHAPGRDLKVEIVAEAIRAAEVETCEALLSIVRAHLRYHDHIDEVADCATEIIAEIERRRKGGE